VIADIFVNQVYRFKDININPKSIVIDIGAHRGAFTAYAALHSTTVISYEPHPENYKHILELIEINSLKNVIVHNVAIGARAGKGYLFNSPMSSRHHLVDNSSIDERDNSLEINILSLDECLQPFELIDFLKMDCEGAEVDILLNASDKTISKVRCIAAEIHDPITSSKIQELYLRLTCIFKDISLVDQNKDNLGYLYAVQ
jgi:FkbM family methyltransferase